MLVFKFIKYQKPKFYIHLNIKHFRFYIFLLTLAIFLLVNYLLSSSEYGPIIPKEEAITLPEFYPDGRASFFNKDPIKYWFLGIRSGMLPRGILTPVTLSLGLLFPLIIRLPQWFPLIQQIRSSISFIPKLLLLSIGLFFAAHLLLFQLFLPNRYTSHSFYLIIAILAGITITVLIDTLLRVSNSGLSSLLSLMIVVILGFLICCYPSFLDKFTSPNYIEPKEPALYDFLSQQPKEIQIASLAEAADNIPSFSKRSVLTAWEYAIPYQMGYYSQIRQRTLDLIQAQYSLTIEPMQVLINQYNIDLILLDAQAFILDYFDQNAWLIQWEDTDLVTEIQQNLKAGQLPALTFYIQDCSVYNSSQFIILKADCLRS